MYYGGKTEAVAIQHPLTVEHILPQSWIENWPLSDGAKGMDYYELIDADEDDPRTIATRMRNALLQTFGNLTILTCALNSSVSNRPSLAKRPELLRHSLLPINQQLHDQEVWDEAAIGKRSDDLLARALKLWPRN